MNNAIANLMYQLSNPGLGRLINEEGKKGTPWGPLPEGHDLELEEEFKKLMDRERRSGDDLHRSIFDFLDWD